MTKGIYTENIADFGSRERDLLCELLKHKLPQGFSDQGIKPAMNTSSGFVFLVNEDYQCAMMNGDSLEIFHSTPYEGHEGFLSDLTSEYTPDDLNREDTRYIRASAEAEGFELPASWNEGE